MFCWLLRTELTNCWMHLKSTSETPSLIVVAVTPRPSVFDTMCAVVGVVVVPVPAGGEAVLLLLPQAAVASASATVSATKIRRPFMPASPGVGRIISRTDARVRYAGGTPMAG